MTTENNIKGKIRTVLTEARIYRSQGLLDEAIWYYRNASEIIEKNDQIKNKETLLTNISKKIQELKEDLDKLENAQSSPEMPVRVQDLIKNKFGFSADERESALEGAIALAKFGQYERALKEFLELVNEEPIRLAAAKNVIRCLVALSMIDDAVDRYQEWLSGELFNQDQLYKLNLFFKGVLESKGSDVTLPQVEEPMDFEINGVIEPGASEDEFMDISSIGITLDSGSEKGRMIDLDVSFQQGNEINLLISSKDKVLIDSLKVGFRLNEVQFYSPFAIFTGSGVVSAKTRIKSGPKQGDYSLDIKVVST